MTGWRAVYRLQLTPAFGFVAARELVPYLRDLGVSHLYLSPSLQARRGSEHGYDVVDPTRVDEERGGEEGFRALAAAAREAGLGILLDVVPNHMATSEEENRYWRDPELRRRFFDVEPETGWHRRFFDIGELGGVRVEDPEVFEETHRKVLELVGEGLVDGLRIDHPDGLADPRGYLERLRDEGVRHVWVEKILEPGERLRDWPVEGTTGYEFANDVTALFVDPAAEGTFDALWAGLTGERDAFAEVAAQAKRERAATTFEPELERLRRAWPDAPPLEEPVSSLHVYRTYVEPWSGRVEEADREQLAHLPDELRRVLLLEEPGHDEFVVRFQQTTGPVHATGVENTAFYRYNRLVALNEVGGDPGRFWLPVSDFHRANAERAARYPRHLLTTLTHDTKRSGDVRARLVALTWLADEWRALVLSWRDTNARLRTDHAPDASEEYLLYQTLAGTWPIERERLVAYLEKALREAKRNTSWVEPNAGWEEGVRRFVAAVLDHDAFLGSFEPFAARVAEVGRRISVATTLLKLTAPGVPDLYQGDELEALHLVDPDNRRPVDWERRRLLLEEVRAGAAPNEETMKLHVAVRALDLRRRRPEAFEGGYEPVAAGDGLCAYRRGGDVLVAVPVREGGDARRADPGTGWRDLLPEYEVGLWEREAA